MTTPEDFVIAFAVLDLEETLDAYAGLPMEFQMQAALDWSQSYKRIGEEYATR